MRTKLITVFVAGTGMFAFVAASQAQNMPSSPRINEAPIDSKRTVTKRATGEVTSVDVKRGKLIVKTSTDELNLNVQGGSAKNSLVNIKVGDKVNINYQDQGGLLVASSVSRATDSSARDDIGASSKN